MTPLLHERRGDVTQYAASIALYHAPAHVHVGCAHDTPSLDYFPTGEVGAIQMRALAHNPNPNINNLQARKHSTRRCRSRHDNISPPWSHGRQAAAFDRVVLRRIAEPSGVSGITATYLTLMRKYKQRTTHASYRYQLDFVTTAIFSLRRCLRLLATGTT